MQHFLDGYVPDKIEAKWAAERGLKPVREQVLSLAAPWDATDQPPIATWESFKQVLDAMGMVSIASQWWRKIDVKKLFTASQGNYPNCAGFALANAYLMRLLIQCDASYSEQAIAKMNPMATWLLSKGGSTWGGQTISAIMDAGRQYGNFPAAIAGEYGKSLDYRQWRQDQPKAAAYQSGFCLYDGPASQRAQYIVAACRAGFTVVIGNSVAVSGCRYDISHEAVAVLGGSWAHATSFGGYQQVNGTEYVFWVNSHGDIYDTDSDTPRFGCWMDVRTLEDFCDCEFCDIAFVTYSEAPYRDDITPTLVPEVE